MRETMSKAQLISSKIWIWLNHPPVVVTPISSRKCLLQKIHLQERRYSRRWKARQLEE